MGVGRNASGFTLVEALVALFLIAIGVLAAAPMFVHASKESSAGADLGSVGAIAVARMEVLRSGFYLDLAEGGSLDANLPGYSDTSDPDFVVRWRIEDNATPPDTKTITVRAIAVRQTVGRAKEATLMMMRAKG